MPPLHLSGYLGMLLIVAVYRHHSWVGHLIAFPLGILHTVSANIPRDDFQISSSSIMHVFCLKYVVSLLTSHT